MDEYLSLTLLSRPGEAEADFKGRLSAFWSHMLRNFESDFEKVYAEEVRFEAHGDRVGRKYLIEAEAAAALERELKDQGVDYRAIDPDDLYTKYEAGPPDWMWIEH